MLFFVVYARHIHPVIGRLMPTDGNRMHGPLPDEKKGRLALRRIP